MASKIKVDTLETANGSGTIALSNQLSGMTGASMPSGSVIQVVSVATDTATTTSSTSYVDMTNMTASITPSSTSSKILVMVSLQAAVQQTSADRARSGFKVLRNLTPVFLTATYGFGMIQVGGTTGETFMASHPQITVLDSPSSISEQTYKVQAAIYEGNMYFNYASDTNASTITLMEIAG